MIRDGDLRCTKCRNDAIISQRYSGQILCRDHFIRDLEAKAKREIRRNRWLRSGDRICVALSGGYASATVLSILLKLTEKRRDIKLDALHIDNGAGVARRSAEEIAASAGVFLQIEKRNPEHTIEEDIAACASGAGIRAVASGKTLDDEAEAVFRAFISGDIRSLGSKSGTEEIRWIYPLETIPAHEVRLYAALHSDWVFDEREERDESGVDIQAVLGAYTARHPSTLYAVYHIGKRIRSCIPDTKQ
ncbi:hypothetical protein [Methanocalculus sp.]|uniref:hypothetical protein n=1 Tax=Methanocalculus sp. TaxID=2004547 RepID=UPI0026288AFB|nr:hypothetical protein [Methanocalculus sp.]MDG6251271.1 hypothetical protein [Methanocalculus sp.]